MFPNIVKSIINDGHIIGSHSYQHFNLSKMSRDELLDDTANFDEMANALAGYKPKFLRPPYGSITPEAVEVYNQSDVNMKVIGWNIDLQDYDKVNRADDILEQLESMLIKNPGFTHVIYLGHDTARTSVEIVPRLMDFFTFQGFRHTTLDNCLFGGTEFSLRVSTRALEPKPVQRLVIPQGADDTVSAAVSRTLSTWLPPFVALLVAFQMNFPV
ncbi:hypothetical protein BCR44DRAFT_119975 [Catenaria anguillulae PL171]|uniref:NodB homology domain-containing protein n=1 Tax=Catenaria anguillulae PL171 TaxID=765915 RepID=A0A1Y2HJW8_9FUNG|nr:hypothetical protein BCR44DRAFT_119975 [Catenaria anguillulae PL171]